jgi:hypothetical protein
MEQSGRNRWQPVEKCVAAEDGLLIEVVNLGLRRSSEPEEPVLPVAGRIGPPLIR